VWLDLGQSLVPPEMRIRPDCGGFRSNPEENL
jgi:hypothetical protein